MIDFITNLGGRGSEEGGREEGRKRVRKKGKERTRQRERGGKEKKEQKGNPYKTATALHTCQKEYQDAPHHPYITQHY